VAGNTRHFRVARTAALNNAADTLGWIQPVRGRRADHARGNRDPRGLGVRQESRDRRGHPRAGGERIPVDAKRLTLYHRQPDGTWKVARLIVNSHG